MTTHHYKESGLDNVYLENGYEAIETPYGTGMAIKDTEGLHKVIGLWLVAQPIPLNGAELRFLRMEMELSQRELAADSRRERTDAAYLGKRPREANPRSRRSTASGHLFGVRHGRRFRQALGRSVGASRPEGPLQRAAARNAKRLASGSAHVAPPRAVMAFPTRR